jgi:hypothetical protein
MTAALLLALALISAPPAAPATATPSFLRELITAEALLASEPEGLSDATGERLAEMEIRFFRENLGAPRP